MAYNFFQIIKVKQFHSQIGRKYEEQGSAQFLINLKKPFGKGMGENWQLTGQFEIVQTILKEEFGYIHQKMFLIFISFESTGAFFTSNKNVQCV